MVKLIERILSILIVGMAILGGLVGEITIFEAIVLIVLCNIWGATIDIRLRDESADRIN